jgi:hypothetical protein
VQAFLLHHSLESACRAQVGALAGGLDNVKMPDPATMDYAVDQLRRLGGGGSRAAADWSACLRRAERLDPSFKE